MAERPSSTKRLPYIDKLRGLAMLLVILGHCIYFCMYHEQAQFKDAVFSIVCTFHVPLFFFLSGFVIKSAPSLRKFGNKAVRFLLPMLIVGLLNAAVINRIPDFFLNGGHNGYWYLLTLTVFYLMLVPFQLTGRLRGLKGFTADTTLALALWAVTVVANHYDYDWMAPLNPWGTFSYWPFFILGYITRKYSLAEYITGKPWLTVLLTAIYIGQLVTLFPRISELPLVLDFGLSVTAIAALMCLFHAFSHSNTFIDRQLTLIGNSTLDIYVYHYFFIRFISLDFLKEQETMVELLVIVPLTIIIAYASISVGRLVVLATGRLRRSLAMLMLLLPVLSMSADNYDPDNYRPTTDVTLERTNLPIMFIDTRAGGDATNAIHKDYRIAARMKIVNNTDGTNYADTLAHPGQTVDYEGWVAIRYRGNTSFSYSPKKPYNFKTMKTADPDGDKQKTGLLGMPKDNTWVLLAPYGDRSLLRDALVFQLARPYFDYTPRCRYCEMVLDGVYYGVYLLTENIRKGKNRLNLDDPGTSGDELTGGYQLQIDRNDEPHYYTSKYLAIDSQGRTYSSYNKIYFQYKHPDYEDMTPEQLDYIHGAIDRMEDVLASDTFADPDTGYRQYLDPMSFIDQQLSQEFSGNVDGYRLSTNIYKHRDSEDPRFKTALWDFNLAFGNSNAANAQGTDFWRYQNSYLTNYNAYNKVPFWWMRLMEAPSYVIQLKARWAQYRQENYTTGHIVATIDSITTLLGQDGALQRNNQAWSMFRNSTYDMEIDRLKQWILDRLAWMDEQLDYHSEGDRIIMPNASFSKRITGYYDLRGQRLNRPKQGVTIIRYSDGTTDKVNMTGGAYP